MAERRALLESESDYAKSFDKWVITLSGGAIGLTIAFMNDFIADRAAVAKWAVVTLRLYGTIIVGIPDSDGGHDACSVPAGHADSLQMKQI